MYTKLQKFVITMSKVTIYAIALMSYSIATGLSHESIGQRKYLNEITIEVSYKGHSLLGLLENIENSSDFSFAYSKRILKDKEIRVQTGAWNMYKMFQEISLQANVALQRVNETITIKPIQDNALLPVVSEDISARIEIKGKILDEKGEGLPGAAVLEKGTNNGTITDFEGNFSLRVEEGSTLVVSFVGYVSQEIQLGSQNFINIQLQPDYKSLEEVVVVGYGTQKKSDLTGSVASVNVEDIKDLPVVRVDQLLQGRATGVQVTSVNGAPGAGTTIRVRGGNSISASNEPLYVIDGFVGAGDLNSLNPNDVASIEILKDASATAIYGARGANGVVLITTKNGAGKEDHIDLRVSRGWQALPHQIDMMKATEYARLANELLQNNGSQPIYSNPDALGEGTNWQEEVTQVAPLTDMQISASGGSEKSNYYLSGSYFNQRGIILNSGIKRYQFRFNLGKDIGNRLKIGIRTNLSRVEKDNNTINLGAVGEAYQNSALATPPVIPVYQQNGKFADEHPFVDFPIDNPVAQEKLLINGNTITQVQSNVFAEYKLTQQLSLKSTLSADANFDKAYSYASSQLPSRDFNDLGGAASVSTAQQYTLLNENTLTYNGSFGEDHQLNALIGFTNQTSTYENLLGSAYRFTNDLTTYNNLTAGAPETRQVNSDYTSWTILSYLGRVRYSLLDKYLFTLTGRYDGSSRLGENNKWGFFPSGAFAWRLSQEPFIEQAGIFSDLKLRTSFGYTGNQAVGVYATLPVLDQTSYIIGDQLVLGVFPGRLPNPNLKWETTRQLDLGLDIGFFNGRLQFTIDYYSKRTSDLLLDVEIPWQTGFTSTLRNIGAVENQGLELALQSSNIQTTNFSWDTFFNISKNRNTVVNLGGKDQVITNRYHFASMPTGFLKEGQPVGTFYGAVYEGTWKTNEEINEIGTMPSAEPGSPRYRDTNADGIFSVEDFVPIGNAEPKVFGGLGNNFSYKDFSLNIFFQYSYGNDVFNGNDAFLANSDPLTNQYAYMTDRWTLQNSTSDIPKVGSRDYMPSTRWVHDGSFLRLKNVQLTYKFPVKSFRVDWLRTASISLTGTNLFLWDNYNGYDPEVNTYGTNSVLRGYDYADYPSARTIIVSMNFGF